MSVSIDDVRAAAAVLNGEVQRTPCIPSQAISELAGAEVVLKLENLQHTGSFKARGALVRLAALEEGERRAGVVAASAGNHAQGVAYHARRLGVPATIVMPKGTPYTKVGRTETLGARVLLEGENVAQSHDRALALANTDGLRFIHPYDDERIIAGQGTIGLEMLADHPDLEAVIVPVGGGGLIAGIAAAVKALKPEIEVFGAEAALYPCLYQMLRDEEPGGGGRTVADGIAIEKPGRLTGAMVKDLAQDIFLADEASLEQAVLTYLEVQRIVVEGAGAAPLAALMGNRDRFAGRKVGLVVSGGNIDSRLLASILMRGLVRQGRLVRLRIEISDAPGVLAKVAAMIGDSGGNIVEVYHQRLFQDIPVKLADVDVVVETLDADHVRKLIAKLSRAGFHTRLLGGTSGAG
ncbi:MAG: threonine ammonia-lyase [Rhodospirillales bacterium]